MNSRSHILFDDWSRDHLLPFTFVRPLAELRIGILTIREKWERWMNESFSYITQPYLAKKYRLQTAGENLLINASVTPNAMLVAEIRNLKAGGVLKKGNIVVAACMGEAETLGFDQSFPEGLQQIEVQSDFLRLTRPWQLFIHNREELISDYHLLTDGRRSEKLSGTNNLIRPEFIFAEEGVWMEYATLNAGAGPVYLGKDSVVMEGSMIRGPFGLGTGATVKMGARIYGPTTIGPFCKAGGEITNSILFGFSNKVHEGYLGNSVLAEWCNIGADSNTSNLKNNYDLVKLWDYATGKMEETGLQFCGLMMGDYSRCGINTMFNTGTVVGVSSNVFGAGFAGALIPSFTWGGASGFETYRLDKALETVEKAMAKFSIPLDASDRQIIASVFELTRRYRSAV